ncbi:hypothetical protein HPB52_001211 [Rhipicephalus sanguineus]|uniref:Endonuclease/exonuclease/phosphatase domain-containing protein n=1 Tax=Rhipicephalus sanguineus TaxID=34632 RepID=A0A9D4SVF0_RHISA|nr:hypothetical protein HPB52_001211 [Rhipicephalus sanguineus]
MYDPERNRAVWQEPPGGSNGTMADDVRCLVEQYANFTVRELNLTIDGMSTLPENILDNMVIAPIYEAYREAHASSLKEHTIHHIDGTAFNQVFFLSYALGLCENMDKTALRDMVLEGRVSPASARGDQNRLKMAVPNHRTTNTLSTLRIWQWNCRSYRPRYASLQEFVKQDPPDLIALQETNTENVRLLGYNAHVQTKRTAILTKKNLTVQELEPVNTPIEHTVIEVIPERKSHKSLIIASVYSPPKDQLPDFDLLVRELKKRADGHQVVIMGDFNAPHTAWGYHITTKKGARVHDTAQQHRLTLWNDPLQTTRVGNSVSRDTNLDLTFTLNVRSAEWDRLPETLGSDHHIIQLTVAHTRKPARIGTAQITEVNVALMNFNKFGKIFGCAPGTPMNPIRKCTVWMKHE